ncbi:putative transcription factor p65 homolog isoform X5 [Uranotaenia lowii]|uniref:putative transcription factor p65 homolog isoform X5 n=1 Tax=Uranotaenia lowii TaxID=190385 RepID=UPI0024790E50|nr:putative transcription factor p65 homolog isoform X5 [Uranotaenia lowii]
MSFPTRSSKPSHDPYHIHDRNSSASSSSSTCSSDYEYENLFHKFDRLSRSPLAGLYNVIMKRDSSSDKEPSPKPALSALVVPTVNIFTAPEPIPVPEADIIQIEMPPPAPEKPFVVITEQPQSKALRFRYECEGRSAGSIPGVHSMPDLKTFPSIEVRGYKGRAVVVVSCVTKDPPYRPHPHNLVGKEGCKKGVCTVEINSSTMSYTFSNLGIQCVKKKDIEEALRLREEIRVDPFKTGYGHAKQPATIDLNAVRLCFQVFLEGQQRGRFTEPLQPIVSDIIYDKKAMSDLVICKLSDITAPVAGGKEIILLCEKVAKEDISVRFYEEQHGQIVWEDVGEFQHTNVHKQVAICFRTPRYRSIEVDRSVMVNIQLRRPSDGATSEPLAFELLPLDSAHPKRHKKPRISNWPDVTEQLPPDGAHSPTHQYLGFAGYRNPNESPSPAERSPHGNTTPVGPTSPYANSLTPTPGNFQHNNAANNDFFMNAPQQQQPQLQFQNQYNFAPTAVPGNTVLPPMFAATQNQFHQIPPNPQQQYNLGNLINNGGVLPETLNQPGPSGTQGVPNCQQQQQHQATGNTADYNLSSLLDMDLGKDFNMNSSEIKSMLGHFVSNSDIKPEMLQQQQQQQQQQQRTHQQQQQDMDNLSNSFTGLTTSALNDFDK